MSNRNYRFGDDYEMEPVDQTDVLDVDSAMFGDIKGRGEQQIVARPVSIYDIWPDKRQPRRAVPLAIRRDWTGDPQLVTEVLGGWNLALEGHEIDVVGILRGTADGPDKDPDENPVVEEYRELLQLAASIYRDGLVNPITLVRDGSRYVIETGERRWLAHHLLSLYISEEYERIAAVVVNRGDIWRQAAENGQRKPLNAIGMARQLALLIMDMYEGDDGVVFDSYDDVVLPGAVDRAFYAQVANGNVYRIKRGMGQRMLDVTGLKSIRQVAAYRALLSIPDELWEMADYNDWAEGKIRAEMDEIAGTNRAGLQTKTEPETEDTLPIGHVSPGEMGDLSVESRADPSPPGPLSHKGRGGIEDDSWEDDGWNRWSEEGLDDDEAVVSEALESTSPIVRSDEKYRLARRLIWHLMDDPHILVANHRLIKELTGLSAEDLRLMVMEDNDDLEWVSSLIVERAEIVRALYLAEVENFLEFVADLHGLAEALKRKYG